jgi:hypothetical protein
MLALAYEPPGVRLSYSVSQHTHVAASHHLTFRHAMRASQSVWHRGLAVSM